MRRFISYSYNTHSMIDQRRRDQILHFQNRVPRQKYDRPGKSNQRKSLKCEGYSPLFRALSNKSSGERCIAAEINQRGFGICIANLYQILRIYSNHILCGSKELFPSENSNTAFSSKKKQLYRQPFRNSKSSLAISYSKFSVCLLIHWTASVALSRSKSNRLFPQLSSPKKPSLNVSSAQN